jgi:glutaredoxin-like YruB-family protein
MKKVEIYSTPVCKHCAHAKEFFKENNIKYTEHNVIADRSKLDEMVEMTGQRGVPVIRVDDQIMVGYDEDTLRELLLA